MKLVRATLAGSLVILAFASVAFAGPKGSNVFALQLTNGTADLFDPYQAYYISAFDHSEVGAQVQAWHFITDDYATTVSFGLGYFSETDKPGSNPPPTLTDEKYTQNSFNVRVGGDRVVDLGERASLYFGPGIEYWSGSAKFDNFSGDGVTLKSKNVSRYSLSGRLGAIMKLNRSVGLTVQIGRKLGIATADDKGRKATWWPSSFDGACGIAFAFGG